jgi:hypothetical protein
LPVDGGTEPLERVTRLGAPALRLGAGRRQIATEQARLAAGSAGAPPEKARAPDRQEQDAQLDDGMSHLGPGADVGDEVGRDQEPNRREQPHRQPRRAALAPCVIRLRGELLLRARARILGACVVCRMAGHGGMPHGADPRGYERTERSSRMNGLPLHPAIVHVPLGLAVVIPLLAAGIALGSVAVLALGLAVGHAGGAMVHGASGLTGGGGAGGGDTAEAAERGGAEQGEREEREERGHRGRRDDDD